MSLQQFLLILKAHWKMCLSMLAGTVIVAVLVAIFLPKTYMASSAVIVDVKTSDPIAGVVVPYLTSPGYMATQLDIIMSDRVAIRVAKLLKLEEDVLLRERWMKETEGVGSFESWIGELLQKNLVVKPSRESNVITINFASNNPAFAATVANAFAQAYIETNLDLKVEPARQYAVWFEERSKALRERLEQAQVALSSFQREKGIIIASDERMDVENARLVELSAQLSAIEAQQSDTQSRQAQVANNSQSMQEVLQNPLIQSLKSELARQEAKLNELGGQIGENHPQYQRVKAEVESIRTDLARETKNVTLGVGTANRVNLQRESDIRAAFEAQKNKLLQLKHDRDAVAVLQRDVDAAQRAFEAISQRMIQSNLESQSNQTNIAVLTKAVVPTKPAGPKVMLIGLLSIAVGGILGIGTALISELLDRRIRSSEELIELFGIPVIGKLEKLGQAVSNSNSRLPFMRYS